MLQRHLRLREPVLLRSMLAASNVLGLTMRSPRRDNALEKQSALTKKLQSQTSQHLRSLRAFGRDQARSRRQLRPRNRRSQILRPQGMIDHNCRASNDLPSAWPRRLRPDHSGSRSRPLEGTLRQVSIKVFAWTRPDNEELRPPRAPGSRAQTRCGS